MLIDLAELQNKSTNVEKWGIFELGLNGPSEGNPYQEVHLKARFQYKNRIVEQEGFYDGNGVFRIRFMPDEIGVWRYMTLSSSPELDGCHGEFICTQPSLGNHGPVRVKDGYHFTYEDGTAYMPFGTTCYHWTHHGDERNEELTLQTLGSSPFNKVRMCLLPTRDMRPPQLVFAGTSPEDTDRTRFNPAFFAHLEKRIADLLRLGIEADLILFHPYDKGEWGFDSMDRESDNYYLRYVIARLASFRNVWWSLSNEYDFNKFKTVEDWDRLIQFVQRRDPYQRLRSIHNGTKMYESSPLYDFSKPWITHQSIQHWDPEMTTEWRMANRKPIVIDEISYEGNSSRRWGNISGEEMTHRFWETMARGGYVTHGEAYTYQDKRAWISSGGTLQGESAERIAFLRRIMEEGPADWLQAAQDGDYYLNYLGRHQHTYYELALPMGTVYSVEIIDAWNMTVTPLDGTFSGPSRIELSGKPYTALRIRKAAKRAGGGESE